MVPNTNRHAMEGSNPVWMTGVGYDNWAVEGEEEQEQEGHYVSVTKDLKMSDSNWSSEVNLSCSACNSLGCGSPSSLTLYIVGKTENQQSHYSHQMRGSFSF